MFKRDKNGRFIKGSGAYFKGKNLSTKTKKKLSKRHKEINCVGVNLPPSRKGISPPNKGKELDKDVKRKISLALKGKTRNKEQKKKMSDAQLKRWSSIPKKKYRPYYHNNNKKYIKWRMVVFNRDNFTCQGCGLVGVYLEAHHIKGWTKYPKLRYKIDNGVALCKECHKLTDNYGNKKRK